MFSSKDEKWHEIRSLLSPSFTSSKMKIMFRLLLQKAKDFLNHTFKDKSVVFEIRKSFQKLTADIISTCAYGISTHFVTTPESELYVLDLRAVNMEMLTRKKTCLIEFSHTLESRDAFGQDETRKHRFEELSRLTTARTCPAIFS